jgi:DNA end-binding protein Ku
MEALRRSVGQEAAPAKAGKPAKKARKAPAGQEEMPMPIAGKKPARRRRRRSRRPGSSGNRPDCVHAGGRWAGSAPLGAR